MNNSSFNPTQQERDISSKVVAAMERVSEVFKSLLWEKAKMVGLSPIQIQLLIFVAFHEQSLCKISHLAKEFNVTKPTVSDAIKVLDKKGMISKDFSSSDNRSYSIQLTDLGKELVMQTSSFADPLKTQIDKINDNELENLYGTLIQLIYKLNVYGILDVQRTCYGCKFYEKNEESDYCHLLQKKLSPTEIRLDCPEHQQKISDN